MVLDGLIDIAMSLDGDLLVDQTGDLRIINGEEWFKREINKIVKTDNPEWETHPNIGASLSKFIGKINSRSTAKDIEHSIRTGVGEQFPEWALDVRVVPTSKDSVRVFISFLMQGGTSNILELSFDFSTGALTAGSDPLVERVKVVTKTNQTVVENFYISNRNRE